MEARVPLKELRRSPALFRKTRWLVLPAVCAAVLGPGRPASAAEPTKDQCIDANEAAQTLARSARLREAKRKLQVCVATSCPGPVREDCAQQMNQIELKIPTIVFEAKDENNRDLSAVRVTMDGQPLVETLEGTAIPLDPGQHRFAFQSGGRAEETRTLVLHEAEKDRHERVVLKVVAAAQGVLVGKTVEHAEKGPEPAASDGKTERMIGLALGGAGAVTVIVGAVFGLVANSTYGDTKTNCGATVGLPTNQCNQTGLNASNKAHDQATVSTVAFVAGAALVGAGAYFYFTAPKAGGVSVGPSVGTTGAGLSMRGWW